jgi:large subunit ribosomal protein L6
MSRIGRSPIAIPDGVEIKQEGNTVTVKGPLGELTRTLNSEIGMTIEDKQILMTRPTDDRTDRSLHGLNRSLLANMVKGVSTGFAKVLEIQGVGYRATAKGSDIELALGYSHTITVKPEPGISFEVGQKQNEITVKGIDVELVGQTAAYIRSLRKPEPYKGKGIRYQGEYVRRKAGKAAK